MFILLKAIYRFIAKLKHIKIKITFSIEIVKAILKVAQNQKRKWPNQSEKKIKLNESHYFFQTILQSYSNQNSIIVKEKVAQLCLTLRDPTIQSIEFSRPEYWIG